MSFRTNAALLALVLESSAFGQTVASVISNISVTNAAIPQLDAHVPGRFRPRSLATIWGTGLADTTASTTPPWKTTLAGVEVHLSPVMLGNFKCGTTTQTPCDLVASLLFVSPTQINFLVPDVNPADYGQQELYVQLSFLNNNTPIYTSFTFAIDNGGDFAVFQVGFDCDYGASTSECGYSPIRSTSAPNALGAITDLTGNLIASNNPVHQGQFITLWATGVSGLSLNPKDGLLEQPTPAAWVNFNSGASIWKTPTPVWAGESPQYVGLDQINVKFPVCTGPNATTQLQYSLWMQFAAPSADKYFDIGYAELYVPFLISPGEPTCF